MPPPPVPSRCWTAIYTRQSRSSQGDFSSCEAQLSACLSFVMAHLGEGWVWNGKRYDDEAGSSETLDRPGMQRLLADVRAGEINRVVVYRLDRLSRRIADCMAVLQELKDRQIEFTIVTQPELGAGAQQSLMLSLMATFAQFEQELICERLAESRSAHKRRGRRVAGVVPYGYTADTATKQLAPAPEEARRVRALFRMAAGGKTPQEISAAINRRGWRTKVRVSKTGTRTGGGRWSARQILDTLSNPVYIGMIRDGDTTRPGCHKAIIAAGQFQEVAAIIASRRTREPSRQRDREPWLLSGLIQCGQCGRPMSPSRSGHGNLIYRYYRCRSTTGGRRPCKNVCAPAYELEQYVLEVLGNPEARCSGSGDAQDADRQLQIVARYWATLTERQRHDLLPRIVQKVVFHARRGTIAITLDPQAVCRFEDSDDG